MPVPPGTAEKLRFPPVGVASSSTLRIGGAHRLTRVFVNGVDFGEYNGFNAPFTFDVTRAIRAGAENIIALRVENPPFDIADFSR